MSSEDYSHEITRQAIARACLALGFKRAEPAALDTMADVMKEYIEKIARTSLRCAESHGRAQPGIQDIFVAFESMVRRYRTSSIANMDVLHIESPFLLN